MKVYIVSTGEYSDYSIHSLWSTKELAEQMCSILKRAIFSYVNDVQEYEVDVPAQEKPGIKVLINAESGEEIKGKPNGSIKYPHDDVCISPTTYYQEKYQVMREIPNKRKKEIKNISVIESTHFTLEQALKAARDKRAEVLAKINGL